MTILRNFKIQRKLDGHYWLTGAPKNWKPGDSWLIAHDVFHHFEQDDGAIQHEVMSFGVETWLEEPKSGLHYAISPGTMAGTLEEAFDKGVTKRRLAKLLVPPAPSNRFPTIAPEVREFFRMFVRDGVQELVTNLEAHHDEGMPLATKRAILSDKNIRRYANWVMCGYRAAQQRYPDPVAFQAAFTLLQSLVLQLKFRDLAEFSLTTSAVLVAENPAAAKCVAQVKAAKSAGADDYM